MSIVDLHVHSTRSDGTLTPTQLVDYAIEKKLSAFALTDHDTIEGLSEAINYAADKEIEVIPGIEFSTEFKGHDIHIVALYVPYTDMSFVEHLKEFQDSRDLRNQKMCLKLAEHGISVTYEQLLAEFPDSVLTRAHYANYLVKCGYCSSRAEAFERYIGDQAPCFVPREKITPVQAVQFIKKYHALAVLAHPTLYHMSKYVLDDLVSELTSHGLDALEAVYSTYSASEEREMRALAKKHNLLISGGSDFHSKNKDNIDLAVGRGHLYVPYEILQNLKEKLNS